MISKAGKLWKSFFATSKSVFVMLTNLTFLFLILEACGSSTSDDGKKTSTDTKTNGIGVNALMGPDTNGNGVRDDIDSYIETTIKNDLLAQQAASQYARAMRQELGAPDTEQHSLRAVSETFRAIECLDYVLGLERGFRIGREIDSRVLDTDERIRADLKRNRYLGGRTFPLSRHSQKASTCAFNVSGVKP
jgi:hypothetical protein